MEAQTYTKSILKYLQSTDISVYLTSSQQKKVLGYPQRNQENEPVIHPQLIALDCEMVQTTIGAELCQVFIMDSTFKVLYCQWFSPKHEIVDYVTHITGLTKQLFQAKELKTLDENAIQQIENLTKGKIIVGHDLANDLKVLPINHKLFIDTIDLYPHNFGLPFKNKLKHLALEFLNRPIQWHTHNSAEDAKASLDLALLHIQGGRGIVKEVEQLIPKSHYTISQLLAEAQLELNRIDGLFLRGSRALQLQIEMEQYQSDWDYFCIYRTTATIHGKLIKLYKTDITIYDTKTFNRLLQQNNDIPLVELFFLPKEYQFINKLQLPTLEIGVIRESVGFHIGKCERKLKRFREMLEGPKKQWKILKVFHLEFRFLDYFLQLHETKTIFDVKRSKSIWDQVKELYLTTKSFVIAQKWIKEQVKLHNQSVRKVHKSHRPLRHHAQEKYLKKQISSKELPQFQAAQPLRDQMWYLLKKYVKKSINASNPLKLALITELAENHLENIEEFKIGFNRHKIYPNLIQLHYLQSASFSQQICRESRGIIVDQARNYEIVSLPYSKFFDYNDAKFSQVTQFDWQSCKVYEKYDGSIAVLYCYNQQWWVSSSRVPDGSNSYCFARTQTTTEFKLEFWKIFYKLGYKMPAQEDSNLTFIFELLSKDHIIVVRREESNIVLHGVVDRKTGQELDHEAYALKYGWNSAKPLPFQINNIEEAVKLVEELNPLKQQGFILCDKNKIRLKVKNSGYLRANWLAQLNLTPLKNPSKYILTEVILSGDHETFCSYCPEWKPLVQQIREKIDYLNSECDRIYGEIKHLQKKQQSMQVKKCQSFFHPFLFALCDNYSKWHNRLESLMAPKRFNDYLEKIIIL